MSSHHGNHHVAISFTTFASSIIDLATKQPLYASAFDGADPEHVTAIVALPIRRMFLQNTNAAMHPIAATSMQR